jgi:glycosyltransferase involved in cell wall biosynthesis
MKLLIVSQYYWPEFFLINQLSLKLIEAGHQITVITGKPNYPEGEVYAGYKSTGICREKYGEVEVIRIPLRPRKSGALGLILNYGSFVLSGLWYMPRLLGGREFDAILVYAISPITAVIPAIRLKYMLGAHLATWVQDLWPQSLASTGYIKNKYVLSLTSLMVRWIYKHSDTLLAQSKAFVEEIAKYASRDKVFYYPNSIDSQRLECGKEPDIETSVFNNGFSVVFAGNIGSAQAIPVLIKAASLISKTDCQLIFIGSGSMLEWAKQEVLNSKLKNVHFLGKINNKYMPWVYAHSDVMLVSLVDEDIFSYTIPSKLQASLASGKPIAASINGEAAEIIQESGGGLVSAAEDSGGLAKSILKLRNMTSLERSRMGNSGLEYFRKFFDMNVQAQNLVDILEQRIRGDL